MSGELKKKAGRPVKKVADVKQIQSLAANTNKIVDLRPIIAVTMYSCDCTFNEIAEVFGITRQMAETLVKSTLKELV